MSEPATAAPPAAASDGAECKCTKDQWPVVILCMGFTCCFLVSLVSVLNLMAFKDGIPGVMISVYIIALAAMALFAELRLIKFLRGLIYKVIRYMYFLTNYYGRGLFYIFLGSIVLDTSPLQLACGIATMVLGFLILGVHTIVGLPSYPDPDAVQQEREERIRRLAMDRLRSGKTPGAYNDAAFVAGVASAAGYIPPVPGSAAAPGSTAVPVDPYTPPVTAATAGPVTNNYTRDSTAYMQPNSSKNMMKADANPYEEEPIEPAMGHRAHVKDDKTLEEAYYNSQAAGKEEQGQQQAYQYKDPFAMDDNAYHPPKF